YQPGEPFLRVDPQRLLVCARNLLVLRCFTRLPVAHAQTRPGPPSAPPVIVSVIEVSPKALPLYTEYTGTTNAIRLLQVQPPGDMLRGRALSHPSPRDCCRAARGVTGAPPGHLRL